ncbi:MAG: FecR family protein [Cyclobacteriaceae bacterium]
MPNQNYTVKSLLLNEYFQQWVKAPDPENEAYWQNFIHQHPDAKENIAEARQLIEQLDFSEEVRSLATKASVKKNIDDAISQQTKLREIPLHSETRQVNRSRNRFYSKVGIGIAASLSSLVLLLSIYFVVSSNNHSEYTTVYGETKTIVLPDQSTVTLNANSSLRLAKDNWSNTLEREVWLDGEAFFEVKRQKTPAKEAIKFVVHSGNVSVEVLGTKFNVNNRHRATQVVLSSGEVKLSIQRDTKVSEEPILMKPGELVAVDIDQREVERKMVDPAKYTSWTENKLVFDNTSLAKIGQLIEDNYGLHVTVKTPALLDKEFTGAAPADDLDVLLEKLALVYNLNIARNDNELIIQEK